MVPWVSSAFKDSIGLRTEDVSRICYQLWSAIAHCAKHTVIRRDIKPRKWSHSLFVVFNVTAVQSDVNC